MTDAPSPVPQQKAEKDPQPRKVCRRSHHWVQQLKAELQWEAERQGPPTLKHDATSPLCHHRLVLFGLLAVGQEQQL